MNFAMYFQGKRQAHLHHTDPMTSKSMSKRAQNPFTDQSTPCPPWNSQPCENSSKNIPGMVSSAPHFRPTHIPCTCQNILQNRPQTCLPPGPHCRRRRAQDHILHMLQLIQMVSNAFQTLQCASSLPEVHQ